MVGEHAARNATPIGTDVQIERLLDAVGLQPACFSSRFKRPRLRLFPVNLAGGLRLHAVDVGNREQDRIDRAVLGSRERERLDAVGACVEAYVRRRVVDAVRIGRGVRIVWPDIFRVVWQLRVGVDQEREVRPVFGEFLVVAFRIDDVSDPCE